MKWPASPPLRLALLVMAFTAWRSEGYHHPDEHFQILEFASYRLGHTPASDLPWEFAAQIRPGLQPFLAYCLMRVGGLLGLTDPFVQVFCLRLLSGWAFVVLVWAWGRHLARTSGEAAAALRWAALGLWFVPYLAVRFSSEQWGGLCFSAGALGLLGLYAHLGDPPSRSSPSRQVWAGLGVGFLLALSFFFRYQMGFAVAGVGAWMLWRGYVSRAERLSGWCWLGLFGGAAVASVAGFAADLWLYGEPVFAPYNYFAANILENKAAHWGTSPWWYYAEQMVLTAVPPISLVGLLWLGRGWWQQRSGALSWGLLAFLLAHMAVGHKEARFLYPMLLPALVLAVQGAQGFSWKKRWGRVGGLLFGLAFALNLLLLPLRCAVAAQESVPAFRFLYRYAAKQPVTVLSAEREVYELVGLPVWVYRSPHVQTRVLPVLHPDSLQRAGDPSLLLFSPRLSLPAEWASVPTRRVYAYFPDWVLRFNPNDWQSRARIWTFYATDP